MTGNLHLVPYDRAWPEWFAREAVRLDGAVGEWVKAIEHVGSTAVPGLLSKPVIDIAAAVESEEGADACVTPVTALGYEYRGLHGDDPRRRYYVLNDDGRRVAQLHVYILPARAWTEMLAFRDALRSQPGLAADYAREKRRVAEAVEWDKAAYSLAKGPFISSALSRLVNELDDEGAILPSQPPS